MAVDINNIIEQRLRKIYKELQNEFNWEYNGPLDIRISKRLRSSNGKYYLAFDYNGDVEYCKIIMSKALLDEFGWESFEKTFRHEVAHIADHILYRGRNHNESFKRLCRAFGGTMNKRLAGHRYSDCANSDYVKPITKWIYYCPCGKIKKMAKRMNKRKRGNSNYRCGRCKTYTLDKWTEERVV